MIVFVLNILSASSAFAAAYFWWASAKVEVPKQLGVARWGNEDSLNNSNPEKDWATNISTLSSRGAIFAAISAVLMAFATLASLDWSIIK